MENLSESPGMKIFEKYLSQAEMDKLNQQSVESGGKSEDQTDLILKLMAGKKVDIFKFMSELKVVECDSDESHPLAGLTNNIDGVSFKINLRGKRDSTTDSLMYKFVIPRVASYIQEAPGVYRRLQIYHPITVMDYSPTLEVTCVFFHLPIEAYLDSWLQIE